MKVTEEMRPQEEPDFALRYIRFHIERCIRNINARYAAEFA